MSAPTPAPLIWVQFEPLRRYHAIADSKDGVYWTWCARRIQPGQVIDLLSGDAPVKCRCCRNRMQSLSVKRVIRMRDEFVVAAGKGSGL